VAYRRSKTGALGMMLATVMSLYAKYVLPRITDLAMNNRETRRLRATLIPHARGEVLEVGIGSGLNLEFYSPEVERIYGVDPSRELQRMARKRLGKIDVQFLSQSAEEPLPPANASNRCALIRLNKAGISLGNVLRACGARDQQPGDYQNDGDE